MQTQACRLQQRTYIVIAAQSCEYIFDYLKRLTAIISRQRRSLLIKDVTKLCMSKITQVSMLYRRCMQLV